MRTVCWLIAGCALLHAANAKGAIVFSSFGPGLGYDAASGVNIDGPATAFPQGLAEPFAPSANATLDSVELAVSTALGGSQLSVRVYADASGLPGELLEETPLTGFSGGVATAAFGRQLVLSGGTHYWLGAFTVGSNQQIWHDSTSGDFSLQAFSEDDGATWSAISSDPFPRAAFRVVGTVVAPPDVSFIAEAAAWKYVRGLAEPSVGTQWTMPAFDDSAWDFGIEGFGYDTDAATQDGLMSAVNTPLPDMREDGINPDPYSVLYLRRTFTVNDPAALDELILQLDFDDSFIAYVNGVEIARSSFGTVEAPEPFDALGSDHESTNGDPNKLLPRFSVNLLNDFPNLLHAGADNILAIQGLNTALDDSDFVLSRISLSANLSLPGDTNSDGRVDLVDLNNVRNNFGSASADVIGDTNSDHAVNLADLNHVRNNFGSTFQPAPEPTTAVLGAVCLMLFSLLAPHLCRRHAVLLG